MLHGGHGAFSGLEPHLSDGQRLISDDDSNGLDRSDDERWAAGPPAHGRAERWKAGLARERLTGSHDVLSPSSPTSIEWNGMQTDQEWVNLNFVPKRLKVIPGRNGLVRPTSGNQQRVALSCLQSSLEERLP